PRAGRRRPHLRLGGAGTYRVAHQRLPGGVIASSLAGRRLYLCTPDRPDLESFVDACVRGGVDIVQLREKHLDDDALVTRARVVREVCRAHGVPFILNDRPDLAVAAGADGVHVGQEDASPADARAAAGATAIA